MKINHQFKNILNLLIVKENLYFLTIIFLIFFLDRYFKNQVINNLSEHKLYLNNFLNLDLTWNTGIGFGLLSTNSTIIYSLITILIGVIISLLIIMGLSLARFEKIVFSIIIGGAIGNLYDRIVFNAVPDFIDIHYKNFHWFTFNLADIFITIGIMLYLLITLLKKE